jgi:hypothetical protein
MPEKITSEMLSEFGPTMQGFFWLVYPNGASPQELKDSPHKLFRWIYEHFKRKAGDV